MSVDKACHRRFLIAVDDSENSIRSIKYCAKLLRELRDTEIFLLHIIPEPDEDYFRKPEQKQQWIDDYQSKSETLLQDYRNMLMHRGIQEKSIQLLLGRMAFNSIAECILAERKRLDAGTIVIGRRGVSRSEEFLFGSTSSRIVHYARECAVWIIE